MIRSRTRLVILATVYLGATGLAVAAGTAKQHSAPVQSVRLPRGYRNWQLISVAHEAGRNDDIRAILGNAIAMKAFRDGTRPFPDGTVIARLAWKYQSSARNDAVFPVPQSYVAGAPTNLQISVKNKRRYAATNGWGYAQFDGGKPNTDRALTRSCAACHAELDAKSDFVFTSYAP